MYREADLRAFQLADFWLSSVARWHILALPAPLYANTFILFNYLIFFLSSLNILIVIHTTYYTGAATCKLCNSKTTT